MTEAAPILDVKNLMKRFGGLVATNDVTFDVRPGETHAMIGPNGAGKTTLISQLQGFLKPDSGAIRLDGIDVTGEAPERRAQRGVARSFQIASLIPEFTALQHAALAVQVGSGHSFRFWKRAWDDERLTTPARAALERVGLGARADTPAADLAHGERRQLELAIALAQKPRLLLLDEPMAGVGRQEGLRLTETLRALKSDYSIVLIEHDMDAVFALADRISVLVAGRIIKTGTPAEICNDPDVRAAYLGHD